MVTIGLTTMVRLCVPIAPMESVAVTRNVKVPLAVGVPLKTPAELKAMPAGKFALTVVKVTVPVPPVDVTVWL